MAPDAKSIGTAIDELIAALEPLEATARQTAIRAAGRVCQVVEKCERVIIQPLMA